MAGRSSSRSAASGEVSLPFVRSTRVRTFSAAVLMSASAMRFSWRAARTFSKRHFVEKGNSMSQPAWMDSTVELVPVQSEMTVLGGLVSSHCFVGLRRAYPSYPHSPRRMSLSVWLFMSAWTPFTRLYEDMSAQGLASRTAISNGRR